MNRGTKQIAYGSLYAGFWLLCAFGFYVLFFQPVPTCTDNIKNQDEAEVDCGGQFCVSCEIKKLSPLQLMPVKLLSTSDANKTTLIIESRNPNTTYGAEHFVYDLKVLASNPTRIAYSERIDVPMYPGELKYRVAVNVPVSISNIISATTTLVSVSSWRTSDQFPKPKLPTRDIKTSVAKGKIVVSGFVKNENPFALRRVNIAVFFEGKNKEIYLASKTNVNDLLVAEERSFQIVVPLPETADSSESFNPRLVVDGER
jgi:hypothetical protein